MRVLKQYNKYHLLFIDIETVSVVEDLDPESDLYRSWAYKCQGMNIEDPPEILEAFKNQAALYPEFAKIICISIGRLTREGHFNIKSYADKDEKDLLENFSKDLEILFESNPNFIFAGHAVKGFDLPFIAKRCLINRVELNEELDFSGIKPWDISVLDTNEIWKGTSFSRASLINIAVALGLPSPKDDMSGKDVGPVYYQGDLSRIVDYCEGDVTTVANVVFTCRGEPTTQQLPELFNEAPTPLITALFFGKPLEEKDREAIHQTLSRLNLEDRVIAGQILKALCSTAKGSKTLIKSRDIDDIMKEI